MAELVAITVKDKLNIFKKGFIFRLMRTERAPVIEILIKKSKLEVLESLYPHRAAPT